MPLAIARRRPLPKPSPETDPRFRKVTDDLKRGAAKTKAHPPAARKAAEASAAAKGPANEKAAGAKSKQVDKLEDAPAKKPETQSFLDMLRAEIRSAMPKTLGDTEDFMKGGSAGEMKGSLKGNVSQKKDEASGDIRSASQGAPNEAGVATKDAQPIPAEPAPFAPAVDGAQGMPAPKSEADISLQDSKQDTEAQMKEARVTPTQLTKANDPRFSAVLSAKDAVGKQADSAPAKYRTGEKGLLTAAASQARTQGHRGAAAIVGVRGHANSAVLTKQAAAKAKDELERKQVTDHIEAIYTSTKAIVDLKLSTLDVEVGSLFDSGIDAALKTMTDYVDTRMDAYKFDRYWNSTFGSIKWAKDKLLGLPDDVNVFYEEGRAVFTRTMDALVVRVASLVEQRLREAKAEVAKGQAQIATYVSGLSPKLKTVGRAAQKEVEGRFKELEQGIEDKKGQLAQALAQKYKEAFDKANDALSKIQEENKGLVTAFVEKLGEIVKILLEFKDKLMALLRKGADAIGLILDDPIGFLGNLIGAIKLGIQQFVDNIWTHLQRGFMKWLFGSLAEAGIQIPTDLTLPSILKLVLGVLGITYERMRAKAVKLVGERAVKILEKVFDYVKALITGGPAALWEKVKEDLGNLKEMVIDAIQNYLIDTVIKQAVLKLVSMFNPAGAIVQAIIAIYNTVTFLIEKASQIMALVEAVINSVTAIAQGNIASAANWIENALGNTIPLVIGFLAQLIGLGGLSKKIKEFITKVQDKVDKAIDKAIAKVVALVKKLFGGGKDKEAKPDERTPEQKQADLNRAVADAKALPENKRRWPFIKLALRDIKAKYRLTELTGTKSGTVFEVQAAVNPSLTFEMIFESEAAKAIADEATPKIEALGPHAALSAAQAIVEAAKANAFKSSKEAGAARMVFEQTKVGLKAVLTTKDRTDTVGVITNTALLYIKVGTTIGGHPKQSLFRNRVNDQIVVAAANGLYAPRYVLRNISEADVKTLARDGGMTARDPHARITPLQHVIGSVGSQYVSTSTKPDVVNPKGESFNKFGQRKIDLSRIAPDDILNLSSAAGQKAFGFDKPSGPAAIQALADVQRTGEVLIRGKIPQEAIV